MLAHEQICIPLNLHEAFWTQVTTIKHFLFNLATPLVTPETEATLGSIAEASDEIFVVSLIFLASAASLIALRWVMDFVRVLKTLWRPRERRKAKDRRVDLAKAQANFVWKPMNRSAFAVEAMPTNPRPLKPTIGEIFGSGMSSV